jgi:hypothetical protein
MIIDCPFLKKMGVEPSRLLLWDRELLLSVLRAHQFLSLEGGAARSSSCPQEESAS